MADNIIKNKKGNIGWMIKSWDGKGVFYYQQVEVISCGKRQMALRDYKNSTTIGRHFYPSMELYVDENTARAKAVEAANLFIEDQKRTIQSRISENQNRPNPCPHFNKRMEEKLAFFESVTGKGKAHERAELLNN